MRQLSSSLEGGEADWRELSLLLEHAQELAGVGTWVWYPDTNRNTWSAEARRIYGLTDAEADTEDGALFFELVHPEDRALVNETSWRTLDLSEPTTVEHRILRRSDGELRWVRSRCEVEVGADGRPYRLVGAVLDVSESRLSEAALRETTALLTEAQRIARVGSFVWYPDGSATWSEEGLRIFGLDTGSGEPSRELFLSLVHPDDREAVDRAKRTAFADGGEYAVEFRIVRRDGQRWLRELAHTDSGPDGRPRRMLGVILDVTEARLTEAALRRQATMLERAHELARLGSFSVDVAERRLDGSREVGRLLGRLDEPFTIGVDEFRRRFVHEDDVEPWSAEMNRVYRTGGPFSLELRLRRVDGTVFWGRVHGNVELAGTGVPERAIGVLQDVTEQHRLEEQLRQAQKLEAVGQLAGGIAHDFNNLLTVIAGNAQLALGSTDDEDVSEDMREILRSAERASALVRQLLAFSRADLAEPRVIDLNETVAGVRSMLSRLLEENIEVHAELAAGEAHVLADPGQLEQVLLNLAVNARDAMPGGGRLTIGTGADERTVALTVSDTGMGMDEHTRERIFDPFFTTKPRGAGTGLGLSTVYGIVVNSGGEIDVDSTPGEGTTFTIRLPRAPALAGVDPEDEPPPLVPGSGERILIVEDEPLVRAIASELLTRAGYEIAAAENAEEALRLVDAGAAFDLVLSDLMMPGLTGTELLEELRLRGHDVPAIFTSGYAEGTVDLDGRGGDVLFVSKPFSGGTLTAAVRRLLD